MFASSCRCSVMEATHHCQTRSFDLYRNAKIQSRGTNDGSLFQWAGKGPLIGARKPSANAVTCASLLQASSIFPRDKSAKLLGLKSLVIQRLACILAIPGPSN